MSDVLKTKASTATADDDFDVELLNEVADVQTEADAINMKATHEILAVESRYNKLRKPHYEKRSELIKRIPNFWITSILNHRQISSVIDDLERDCLRSLSVVDVFECEDLKDGYRITFYFDENPYFYNEKLSKEFTLHNVSFSTAIEWKEGKDLLEKVLKKPKSQQPEEGIKKRRPSEYKSFFDWFDTDTEITTDNIAMAIRDELWINPLQYYLMKDIPAEPENNGGGVEGKKD